MHLDVVQSACYLTNLISLHFWGRPEDLQFILVAIHTAQNLSHHSVLQVAVRACNVVEMSLPKNYICPIQYESADLQIFGDKLALILFESLLCFLREKPIYSISHTIIIPSTKQTFLRVYFPILNYLNTIHGSVHS